MAAQSTLVPRQVVLPPVANSCPFGSSVVSTSVMPCGSGALGTKLGTRWGDAVVDEIDVANRGTGCTADTADDQHLLVLRGVQQDEAADLRKVGFRSPGVVVRLPVDRFSKAGGRLAEGVLVAPVYAARFAPISRMSE